MVYQSRKKNAKIRSETFNGTKSYSSRRGVIDELEQCKAAGL